MATATTQLADYPFFLQKETGEPDPIYYSAADFRRLIAVLNRRSGVLGPSHFLVTQADIVGFSIKVNAGYANVGGTYIAYNAAPTTISLTDFVTSPPTTRTHKVYVAIYDALMSGTEYAAKIVVTEDTGAGAPTPPAATVYLQLATITVANGQANIQNSNIKNTARHGSNAAEYEYLESRLASGYTPGSDSPIRAQYDGNTVRLSGMVRRASGNFASEGSYTVGTLPSNYWPARQRVLTGATSVDTGSGTGTYTFRLVISTEGALTCYIPTGQTVTYLHFDGLIYDLD